MQSFLIIPLEMFAEESNNTFEGIYFHKSYFIMLFKSTIPSRDGTRIEIIWLRGEFLACNDAEG